MFVQVAFRIAKDAPSRYLAIRPNTCKLLILSDKGGLGGLTCWRLFGGSWSKTSLLRRRTMTVPFSTLFSSAKLLAPGKETNYCYMLLAAFVYERDCMSKYICCHHRLQPCKEPAANSNCSAAKTVNSAYGNMWLVAKRSIASEV